MRKRKPVLLNGEALMADGKPLEFDAVNQEELDGKIDAPQVAQVGEVLTVEEVGEDGKPKKWKTQAVQTEPPDWNENDPTKPGYVKNRPFYKSDENPLGTLTFTATATNELAYTITEMGLDTISGIYNMTKIDVGGGVPKGQLRVVVSGQSYLTESESDRGHFSFSGSGISGHGYYRTGDATTITIDDGSMSLTVGEFYDVSFFDINSSGYVKIPTEYFSKEVFTQNSAPVKYGDGNQSTIQGDSTKATGYSSHAEGNGTKALEQSSHAEGSYTTASGGVSHAEGNYTTASGETSHAEGYCTEAFGSSSHAEGDHTVASNKNMHTSGKYNVIEPRYKIYYRTGNYFFNKNAEYYCSDTYTLNQKTGKFTLNNAIKKIFTQCMGKYVSMDSVSENVDGVFKVLSTASGSTANYYPCNYYYSETLANDIGTYSHIVGNGTSDTERSNAYTLDWEGNAWFAGDVYVHSTSGTNKDEGSVRLATEDQLTFCDRVVIMPTKNDDGTITYSTNFTALLIYGKIFKGHPLDYGNSIECCLIPIKVEDGNHLTVLNYTGMSVDQNSDGNVALTIRFSSYVSDKQISAEIKDTISGFGTDNEKILSTVVTVTENALVSYSMIQELTREQQELAKRNIGAGTLRKVYYWDVTDDTLEAPNSVMRCAGYGDTCICLNQTMLPHGMVGPVLVIYGEISYGRRYATAFDGSNATWTFSVNLSDYSYSTPIKKSGIPTPTTAQVGQIVKVKAVDADGKITETEAVDMPTVPNDYELVFQETVAEDVIAYSRDTDKDGNPFSLTDVMVIIFTKPFAESTNSGGRSLGFLPTSRWGHDNVSCEIGSSISSANTNSVGRYNVVFAKVVNGYQVVTRAYESQNTTNVFGVLVRQTKANNEMFAFHSDSTKLMQIASPQGNITCVKIVGYTNPLVSAGTIVSLYKRKGT